MSEAVQQRIVKISGFTLQRPRLAPLFIAIVLVAALSLVFVWSRLQAINLEYRISGFETEIRHESEVLRRLQVEAAHLSSHQRIERLARQELGMQRPAPGQVVRLD